MTTPGFGDRVRIADTTETQELGFADRVGTVFGHSTPSSSGVAPVIGERGEDFALSIFFEQTEEQEWFAPHLVAFVSDGGAQVMGFEIDGGPTYERDPDGEWHEVGKPTPLGQALNPGLAVPYRVSDRLSRIRRWLRKLSR